MELPENAVVEKEVTKLTESHKAGKISPSPMIIRFNSWGLEVSLLKSAVLMPRV